MFTRATVLLLVGASFTAKAEEISLPARPGNAPEGSEFTMRIDRLDRAAREREIVAQVERGNVPRFWRRFVEVTSTRTVAGRPQAVTYRVSPDYLAIGSDDDYLLVPVSPSTAQAIADRLDCVLPTRRMVDDIYAAAEVKLAPAPIPPSAEMTTVTVFVQHSDLVRQQRKACLAAHPLGALVAGHKKDIVLTPQLAARPGKVAIYGWHRSDGSPIQPLYLGHTATWVDYSHGTRFIRRTLTVNGTAMTVESVLADPQLSALLSDEGPLLEPRYGLKRPLIDSTESPSRDAANSQFDEQFVPLNFDPGVRVVINSPRRLNTNRPARLVLYALPNGNTIEQTIGRRPRPGDDWHWDLQHIGAQTRWLRERMADTSLVVAYLECAEKSWPAWRRKNDPDGKRIHPIVDALRQRFAGQAPRIVLTGHSGGGSFTFGFLDAVERIPDWVERIAFLDSNYAYDVAQRHDAKLAEWFGAPTPHYLCVLAYHDSVALLNGKTFVSEKGGTWGRSHAMQRDLAAAFPFESESDADYERCTALDGRIQFLLKKNPTKAILHTRQVELNGFIHAMLSGTELEGENYSYFGPRAYERWIKEE